MAEKIKIGKPINVSLRVIADLSQGLYRSPADALKELVSNAYDADSPSVNVDFSGDFHSVTIRDSGKGMTLERFIQVMETIGGSAKRSVDAQVGEEDFTKSGRPIVGRIGIGLLSVSQIASSLELQSTTAGSESGFSATIEFDQFASEAARRVKITELHEGNEQVQLGRYYVTKIGGVSKSQQFTTLKLSGIKRIIREKLRGRKERGQNARMMGTKFTSTKELVDWMRAQKVTKTGLHEYDRLYWELCLLSPVPYLAKAISVQDENSPSATADIGELIRTVNKQTHFQLFYNGIECFKPISLPDRLDEQYSLFFNLLFMKGLNGATVKYRDYAENGETKEQELALKGYFYFQRPKIWPPELQGLLIRVRNVAVGQYDSTFLTYPKHEAFKFSQVTGEIHVDNLDSSLNIDRSSFRETEPAFVALREKVHSYLETVVFPGIKEFASKERKARRAKESDAVEIQFLKALRKVGGQTFEFKLGGDQTKLIERHGKRRSLASSIDGKKLTLTNEAKMLVCHFEASMGKRLTVGQRDSFYAEWLGWLDKIQ